MSEDAFSRLAARRCTLRWRLCLLIAGMVTNAAAAGAKPGDAALGASLAAQGLAAKSVPACAGCHGQQGEGMATAGFPRLSAQSPDYLARQMRSFADGSRPNPVMTPIAKALDRRQISAVSAHYASLGPSGSEPLAAKAPPAGASGAASTERGASLAALGDDTLQVQGCANCHGPGGTGEPPAAPYLAAQHASYLIAALAGGKRGQRRNDASGQMPAIAARLTDADVASLAAHYASQPPVQPRTRAAPRPVASPRPARGQAPATGGRGAEGVGTESGSPLNGGGQSPGGGGGTVGTDPGKKAPPPRTGR